MTEIRESEKGEPEGHLGFIIIKGDLGSEVIRKHPYIISVDLDSEKKPKNQLDMLLKFDLGIP